MAMLRASTFVVCLSMRFEPRPQGPAAPRYPKLKGLGFRG